MCAGHVSLHLSIQRKEESQSLYFDACTGEDLVMRSSRAPLFCALGTLLHFTSTDQHRMPWNQSVPSPLLSTKVACLAASSPSPSPQSSPLSKTKAKKKDQFAAAAAAAAVGDGSGANASLAADSLRNGLIHIPSKPQLCTADELHYVAVPGTNWKLALWHYRPAAEVQTRNHPLLLLSGVGTNAIGFDLDPSVSFARTMASHGFDTWVLEVRGAGLSKIENRSSSTQASETDNGAVHEKERSLVNDSLLSKDNTKQTDGLSETDSKVLNDIIEKSKSIIERQSRLPSSPLLDRLRNFIDYIQLSERYAEVQKRLLELLNERKNSAVAKQIIELSNRLLKLLDDGQKALTPQLSDLQDRLVNTQQITDFQDRLISTIDDFQKLMDLIVTYNWDFDDFLEVDLPAVMEYIRDYCKPKDGKIHAAGHSMGGILIYAFIASQSDKCGLASAVTLAASLDYSVSNTSLKLLLPLADPAQMLNVPAVPLGAIMAAFHPLAINPPYIMAWLSPQVSARDMMDPELFKRLVLNNFCTISAKLLLQLATALRPGGLCNRTGTVAYKDQLHKSITPVLAVAGDEDFICPPEAVLDTVAALPKDLVEYKLFGGKKNIHYGHYDLVGGRLAKDEVHTYIVDFLVRHDGMQDPPA